MEKITFIPEEFNEIKLGYDERKMVKTSPGYPEEGVRMNTLVINTPRVIYYTEIGDDFNPVIPLSAVYTLSSRRTWKYADSAAQIIHVRNVKSGIEVSGEIREKEDPNRLVDPAPYPNAERYRIEQEERRERIKEAQQYSDDDLGNDGYMGGDFINVNVMEYVDIRFLPGKYEIWVTLSGLESNHTIVEVIKR